MDIQMAQTRNARGRFAKRASSTRKRNARGRFAARKAERKTRRSRRAERK
jgi:hypothetical protein